MTLALSTSAQTQLRFERRRHIRRAVGVTYLIASVLYLVWRATIFSPQSWGLSVAYYLADLIGFILGILMVLTSWSYRHRVPPPAPEGLSVDVIIPTYQEPLEVIRRTLRAAKALSYPHRTLILDDAGRDEVRRAARELDVEYFARGRNVDAKAGNLNFGLAQSHAEFVVVFDADQIPQSGALDRLLGFFSDGRVAMVQTPQDYYNVDAIQYFNSRKTGALWHDQSFFYNIAQPSHDLADSATCVGTGVAYRRSALDQIGGIPTQTVTEDLHTSLRLHKHGWKSVFLNEPVAYGIAAADLTEYYKTRHRWAHGNLHALRLENALFCKGLGLRQRLTYLSMGLIYLEGWQQALFFAIPALALTLGLQPFEITVFNVLVVLLYPILNYLLLQELGCGHARFWANEIFAIARFPIHLVASLGALGRKSPWRSSSKSTSGRLRWRMLAPQLTVAAVGILAVAIGLWRLWPEFRTGPIFQCMLLPCTNIDWNQVLTDGYTVDLVLIAGFWALYNTVRALFFTRLVVRQSRRSKENYRFHIPLPIQLDGTWGVTTEISTESCTLHLPVGTTAHEAIAELRLPSGPMAVRLNLERAAANGLIEARFLWNSPQDRDRLDAALYSVDWHREFVHRNAYFATPLEALSNLLRLRAPLHQPRLRWNAALVTETRHDDAPAYAILSEGAGPRLLLSFRPLSAGTYLRAQVLDGTGEKQLELTILGPAPLQSLSDRLLDGTPVRKYRVA